MALKASRRGILLGRPHAKEEHVDINPSPDEATDPMSEGDIDDPDEVDTEEREVGDQEGEEETSVP